MVFLGSLGLKVSLAEGELRGKEEAPAHSHLPGRGSEGWDGCLTTLCDHHTDDASYSVIFIFPRFGKSKPPEMRQILLHIQICDSAAIVGWFLCSVEKSSQQVSRPQPSGRGRVLWGYGLTIKALDQQMVCGIWPTDTWRFWRTGHSFPLALLWAWQPLPIQEPWFVLLFTSVHLWMCPEPRPAGCLYMLLTTWVSTISSNT